MFRGLFKGGKEAVKAEAQVNKVLYDADNAFNTLMGKAPKKSSSAVPFMITLTMREDLKDLGYWDADIDRMSPGKAAEVIQDGELPNRVKAEMRRAQQREDAAHNRFEDDDDDDAFCAPPPGKVDPFSMPPPKKKASADAVEVDPFSMPPPAPKAAAAVATPSAFEMATAPMRKDFSKFLPSGIRGSGILSGSKREVFGAPPPTLDVLFPSVYSPSLRETGFISKSVKNDAMKARVDAMVAAQVAQQVAEQMTAAAAAAAAPKTSAPMVVADNDAPKY